MPSQPEPERDYKELWLELENRLASASYALKDLALYQPASPNRYRLEGKRQGVELARGYMEEVTRGRTDWS